MKTPFRTIPVALAFAATVFASQAVAQVTLYENEGFAGRSYTTSAQVGSLESFGFRDRAGSAIVKGTRWEVCDEDRYGGRCMVLRPGRYPSLSAMGLNDKIASTRAIRPNARVVDSRYAPLPAAAPVAAAAKATFYADESFAGRGISTTGAVEHFRRSPLESRASSAVVVGERFEVCDEPRFEGRCVVLRPGRYPSPASMDLSNRIASSRLITPTARIEDNRYAPMPGAAVAAVAAVPAPSGPPDYRRRRDEQIFTAPVTAVRAVLGPPEQRCWVERAEVAPAQRAPASVPGAVVGAVIGGILGHQIGGGRGQDVATAGGAVAGGVVGANVGRNPAAPPVTQDVKRCENVTNQTPSYYDVTYNFRGVEHRVQMSAPPGPTITVNGRGEPRA